MDYPIRRIESPIVRPVGPRHKQGRQTPFELDEDGASSEQPRQPEPESDHASLDRPVAPPDDDEAGAHLDLSA